MKINNNKNLKKLAQKTLLIGALSLTASDLTPSSWQAYADHHEGHSQDKPEEKGTTHSCGEGSCGSKDKKKEKKSEKGAEGSCGAGGCGEGSCGSKTKTK